MTLEDVMKGWRSQDPSSFFGVDKTLLHRVLQQEQARLETLRRRIRWFTSIGTAVLIGTSALFLAIMIDPKDDDVLIAWDYVVGIVGLASSITMSGALYAMVRTRKAREEEFGDSLRDHLRRRISQIDDQATRERRLAMIMTASTLIAGWAISIAAYRINDVPWGEFRWQPRLTTVVVAGLVYLALFRWAPRERQRRLERKPQLEALLKDIDGAG